MNYKSSLVIAKTSFFFAATHGGFIAFQNKTLDNRKRRHSKKEGFWPTTVLSLP
jgi:hypothetical protein